MANAQQTQNVNKNQQRTFTVQQGSVAAGNAVATEQQAPVVTTEQPMQATVSAPVVATAELAGLQITLQGLRNARMQRCLVAAQARYSAAVASKQVAARKVNLARVQKYSTAITAAKQQQMLAITQAFYAANGLQAPTQALRSVPVQQRHAQSTVSNACATVRAWVHANPGCTRAQAIAHFAGQVNPATVSTQYQRAKSGIK